MPVDLKDALGIALRYVGAEGPMRCALITKGYLLATNGVSGCQIPITALGLDLAVDAVALHKMILALGDVTLSQAKGRKLVVEGSGSRYTLQAIPKNKEPIHPEVPDDPAWTAEVSAKTVAAIQAAAKLVEKNAGNPALGGLHLNSKWVGAATNAMAAVVWQGLVQTPITVPPHLFDDFEDGVQVCMPSESRIFLRCALTGAVRWSNAYTDQWPEQSINEIISVNRARPDRAALEVDVLELEGLCKRAAVVATSAASPFRLTLTGSGLELVGGTTSGGFGAADFYGTIEVAQQKGEGDYWVGVSVHQLAKICRVVQTVEGKWMSLLDRTTPVMLWGGEEPAIETLLMPLFIEG